MTGQDRSSVSEEPQERLFCHVNVPVNASVPEMKIQHFGHLHVYEHVHVVISKVTAVGGFATHP